MNKFIFGFTTKFLLLTLVVLITSCASISQNQLPDERSPKHIAVIESLEIGTSDAQEQDSAQGELIAAQGELIAAQGELAAALNVKKKPMVALTFDDGPGVYTDSILDILERYNARATFFVVGNIVHYWPNTLIRAVKNGNEVAGHTWHHARLIDLSDKELADTIKATSAIIEKITGVSGPLFFRPPYGEINRRVMNVCANLGYALINWTVDPQDWKLLNANMIYNEVMETVKDNSIVLLHETLKSTATAVERIVPALIEKGYELVTVSELMSHLYEELKPGTVYGAFGIRH